MNGPGSTALMLLLTWMKVLLSKGSMPLPVPFTTTKPAPVGPEWPQKVPGTMVEGNPGQNCETSRV